MNGIVVRDGADEDLKGFAQRLTEIQEKEIAQLQEFMDHHPPVTGSGRRGKLELVQQLHTVAPTDDVDAAYIPVLRMHLNYGIALARKEHERGLHAEMKELAGKIVRSSEKMVAELDGLRSAGNDTLPVQ